MDPDALRKICLSFPGSYEDYPFGPETAVFKVRAGGTTSPARAGHTGKLFALSSMDPRDFYVNLKCEPSLAVQLRAAHPAITGAWHMNKTHWNGVRLDGTLPDDMVRDLVEDSYDLVVAGLPRRQQEQLGWARLAGFESAGLGSAGLESTGLESTGR